MTAFELPSTASPSVQDGNLTLEAYSDRFSSYWWTSYSYEDMDNVLSGIGLPPDSKILIQSDGESVEGPIGEIEDLPEDPTFFVVYTQDYSISWEKDASENQKRAGDNEVGFTFEDPQPEMLIRLYKQTKDEEPSDQTIEKIHEFISEYVDS